MDRVYLTLFFYLKVRSARELDQRTECLPLPPQRVSSSNGRKSTGVTAWRGNTICVITSAVFMGDGIINKPVPPYTTHHPAPAPVPPTPSLSSPLPLSPPHHHRAIHAYLNHPRPIIKKKKAQTPLLTIILSFPVVTGAITVRGPLCRLDMQARQERLELGERRKRVGEGTVERVFM